MENELSKKETEYRYLRSKTPYYQESGGTKEECIWLSLTDQDIGELAWEIESEKKRLDREKQGGESLSAYGTKRK